MTVGHPLFQGNPTDWIPCESKDILILKKSDRACK